MPFEAFTRRAALALISAVTLAACGSAESDSANVTSAPSGLEPYDIVLGDVNAPVTLIEYASPTCPACRAWHLGVLTEIKPKYIETGQVRFVFREFPTPPQQVAVAGAAMARCAGEDKFYDVVEDLFQNQPGILAAARAGQVKGALEAVAARHGIVGEEAFLACVNDADIRKTVTDVVMGGDEMGVSSTPTLFINGQKVARTAGWHTPDGMSALLDEALGVEPSAETPAEAEEAPAVTPAEGAVEAVEDGAPEE